MITCIYNLGLLGIYTEMTEGLNEDEKVVFGGAIDPGCKVKKTKEYPSVGVKYCSAAAKSLVTRLLSFKKQPQRQDLPLSLSSRRPLASSMT